MKIQQVAAQAYTIRESIETAQGFREGCRKLAEIGFQAIELATLPKELSAGEIADICSENGLTIACSLEDFATILDAPESLVGSIKTYGCEYISYAWPHDTDFNNRESRQKLIDRLNHAGAIFRDNGIKLLYHNHALEFIKIDGKPFLETLFDSVDPSCVSAELDTYWVQEGGASPIEWCRKLNGHLPILHLKDMAVYEGNESTFGEIGAGNLDFKSIIAAAEESGCQWFIVEQDICRGDPFDSLEQSFDYIKANLVTG